MSLPNILQVSNITGSQVTLSDLGIPIAGNTTITLSNYAKIREIRDSASLFDAIVADQILLTYGGANLTKTESLRFFIENYDDGGRNPVELASDINVSLFGTASSIDGVNILAGMRVLLLGQTASNENGIWIVQAGDWVRPYDFFTGQATAGVSVVVRRGTANGDAIWVCSSDPGSDVVGSNSLFFSKQESSGGTSTGAYSVTEFRRTLRFNIITDTFHGLPDITEA